MSKSYTSVTPELGDYISSVTLREQPLLARLREETAAYPQAMMQVSPEQGQFLAFLTRLIGARRTLEIGVFTGYSSLSVAMALPDDGRIIACDVNEEWTSVARRYWKEAGVEKKIDLRIGPALPTLRNLIDSGQMNTFDFVFIDADKPNYLAYFDCALELLRPGGVVAADNVLWHGSVIDSTVQDEGTNAIREFNRRLQVDDRIWITLVPMGDGLTLAQKKG